MVEPLDRELGAVSPAEGNPRTGHGTTNAAELDPSSSHGLYGPAQRFLRKRHQ